VSVLINLNYSYTQKRCDYHRRFYNSLGAKPTEMKMRPQKITNYTVQNEN